MRPPKAVPISPRFSARGRTSSLGKTGGSPSLFSSFRRGSASGFRGQRRPTGALLVDVADAWPGAEVSHSSFSGKLTPRRFYVPVVASTAQPELTPIDLTDRAKTQL